MREQFSGGHWRVEKLVSCIDFYFTGWQVKLHDFKEFELLWGGKGEEVEEDENEDESKESEEENHEEMYTRAWNPLTRRWSKAKATMERAFVRT